MVVDVVAGTDVVVEEESIVLVVSAAMGIVVGEGPGSSSGHKAQTPTARPTTIRPAASRRITSLANLRRDATWVKGVYSGPRKVLMLVLYGWTWR
jgi:hypothetical protein